MNKPNTFIGSAIERVEDDRLLVGRGQYVDDVRRTDMVHAVILRSPIAHGQLVSVDASAASAMPGVMAVITAADIGNPIPTIPLRQDSMAVLAPFEQPIIADQKVRYVGEPIAVVIADTAQVAEDALEMIQVNIDMLPATVDPTSAHPGVPLFDGNTNVACRLEGNKGDVVQAFADAEYSRRERFRVQRHAAIPMETRGLIAEWTCEKLTVWGGAKVPFAVRRLLAKLFKVPEESVTVFESDIGGSFGVRGEFYPEDYLVPFCARAVGRPVKWIEDRREHFLATAHAREVECELEIACRNDGTILALRGRAEVDMGAYIRTVGVTPPRNIAQVVSGPYRVPNVHMDVSMLLSNKTPVGTYRGPGRFEVDFFRERLFDMAAEDLKIDRVQFRRMNLVSEAEMPYKLATVMPLRSETECDSGNYRRALDYCLDVIDWSGKSALLGRLIDGRYHGLGVGCYIESGGSGPQENARLVLERDGSVSVFVGSCAVGQGLETTFAQIAADALEVPINLINVFHGSTNYMKQGFGTYGSRSIVMGGSAIWLSASELREKIKTTAASRLGCQQAKLKLIDGVAVAPDGLSLTLAELANAELAAEGSYSSDKRTYSYGSHAAHVSVDAKTGQVRVLEYVAVEDVGRIINPKTLHGQTIGAIVQGLGGALLEHLRYDEDGQLLTASFADYLLPTICEFPNIHAIALQECRSPNNPLGAKGGGEGGVIPVGGVISNAVASALKSFNVRPNELPLSPQRVWRLINATASGA